MFITFCSQVVGGLGILALGAYLITLLLRALLRNILDICDILKGRRL